MESQTTNMDSMQAVQPEVLSVSWGSGKFKWNHDSTILLIAEYGRHKETFSVMRKGEVWNHIAGKLQEKGYPCTGDFCWKKWRNLKDAYKKIRCHHQTVLGAKPITWEYYDDMDDQLFHDPSCQPPPVTFETLSGVVCQTSRPASLVLPASEEPPPSSSSSFEPETEEEGIQSAQRTHTHLQHNEVTVATTLSRPRCDRKRKQPDSEEVSMKETHDLLKRVAEAMEEKNKILKEKNDLLREFLTERNELLRKIADKK